MFLEITRPLLLTLFLFCLFYTRDNDIIYIYIYIYIYIMFFNNKMTARFADLHRGEKKNCTPKPLLGVVSKSL
jgi:hypothetical protein